MKEINDYKIFLATTNDDFRMGRELFIEYSKSLGFDLCFQSFDKELNEINLQYNKPDGGLLLVVCKNEPVGCVGIRKYEDHVGELKRMYINEKHRGKGLGKLLLREAIKLAGKLNYERIRLDTLPSMVVAINIYKSMGFKEIKPYRYNPFSDVKYFELVIDA